SGGDKIGTSTLTNESGHLDPTGQGQIVWGLASDWRGRNKKFTLDLTPTNNQRLTHVTWSYDVDYGWNLLDRYSQFFLRGDPDTLIQYSLNNVQNTLASIPNVDYTKIAPRIVETQPTPVLFVSTQAPRTLDDVDTATAKAMGEIDAAMKKLGVHQAGPRITLTTDYGDENYVFDVAVPIDSATISVNGQSQDLSQVPEVTAKPVDANATQDQNANQNANQPPPPLPTAGSLDAKGHLVVDGDVRAMMMEGGRALEADWDGTGAGIPLTRLALKAYALTHGYTFDDTTHRFYDELVSLPNVAYDQQQFRVFLPLQGDAPAQTPEQAAGKVPALPPLDPSIWAQGAAAPLPAAADQKAAPAKKPAKKAKRH
ncbi:MAG: polyketide cyclase, partial [Rhodanobacteraceae bacterium]